MPDPWDGSTEISEERTMGNNIGSEGRKDLHLYDPNKLTIVTDPANVLCQKIRNETPTPKWLVNSILRNGVTTPIKARRGAVVDGVYQMEVVVGRQRVKAAREANKILVKQGKDPVTVKVESVVGSDEYMLFLMQSENSERVEMSALERAETAAMAINRGTPEIKVITDSFRGSKADFDRHMALLSCAPEVVAAVEDGRVSIKAIDTFTELPREKQVAVLNHMEAEGKTGPREAKDIAATHEETLQNNGTGRPGEEPKTRTKNEGPKLRKAGEVAFRLEALQPFDLDAWAAKNNVELYGDTAVERLQSALVQSIPVQYRSEVETLLISVIRTSRIEELKWVLRDDDALVTATDHDLGGWADSKAQKAQKAQEAEQKAAQKAEEREKSKADKKAAREQEKADQAEAKRKAKEDAATAKATEKAAKSASKKGPRRTQLEIVPEVAPKVPNRKASKKTGKRGRGGK